MSIDNAKWTSRVLLPAVLLAAAFAALGAGKDDSAGVPSGTSLVIRLDQDANSGSSSLSASISKDASVLGATFTEIDETSTNHRRQALGWIITTAILALFVIGVLALAVAAAETVSDLESVLMAGVQPDLNRRPWIWP